MDATYVYIVEEVMPYDGSFLGCVRSDLEDAITAAREHLWDDLIYKVIEDPDNPQGHVWMAKPYKTDNKTVDEVATFYMVTKVELDGKWKD